MDTLTNILIEMPGSAGTLPANNVTNNAPPTTNGPARNISQTESNQPVTSDNISTEAAGNNSTTRTDKENDNDFQTTLEKKIASQEQTETPDRTIDQPQSDKASTNSAPQQDENITSSTEQAEVAGNKPSQTGETALLNGQANVVNTAQLKASQTAAQAEMPQNTSVQSQSILAENAKISETAVEQGVQNKTSDSAALPNENTQASKTVTAETVTKLTADQQSDVLAKTNTADTKIITEAKPSNTENIKNSPTTTAATAAKTQGDGQQNAATDTTEKLVFSQKNQQSASANTDQTNPGTVENSDTIQAQNNQHKTFNNSLTQPDSKQTEQQPTGSESRSSSESSETDTNKSWPDIPGDIVTKSFAQTQSNLSTGKNDGVNTSKNNFASNTTHQNSAAIISADQQDIITPQPAAAAPKQQASSFETVEDQLKQSITASINKGDKQVTINLNPPELGKVSIKFQEHQGQITGFLEVSKIQTRYEIEQALPEIIRNLIEAGVQIKRIEVVVTDQEQQNSFKDQSLARGQSNFSDNQTSTNSSSHDQNNDVDGYEWLTNTNNYAEFDEAQMMITDTSINMLV